MPYPMPWSTMTNRLGGRWLRWLLLGAVAAVTTLTFARSVLALEISGGRLEGELRGMPTGLAIERLAEVIGARLKWIAPAAPGVVDARVAGLTIEEALDRILGERSYLLILGVRSEIHVLAPAPRVGVRADESVPESPGAPTDDREHELEQLRQVAALDQITYGGSDEDSDAVGTDEESASGGDADRRDAGAELDAIIRGTSVPAIRMAAAERLLALDAEQAASALAWLTTDADPAVQQRAEALLAVAQP